MNPNFRVPPKFLGTSPAHAIPKFHNTFSSKPNYIHSNLAVILMPPWIRKGRNIVTGPLLHCGMDFSILEIPEREFRTSRRTNTRASLIRGTKRWGNAGNKNARPCFQWWSMVVLFWIFFSGEMIFVSCLCARWGCTGLCFVSSCGRYSLIKNGDALFVHCLFLWSFLFWIKKYC